MVINKKSWHYKLWAGTFTFWDNGKVAPKQTSLCNYVWRILTYTPAFWLAAIVLIVIAVICWVLYMILANAWNILTGQGYVVFSYDEFHLNPFDPLQFGKYEVAFWKILVPMEILFAIGVSWVHEVVWPLQTLMGLASGLCILALTIALCVGIFYACKYLSRKAKNAETIKLAAAYWRARKTNACPIIQFSDDEPTNLSA